MTLQTPSRSVGCYLEFYKTAGAAKAALTRLDKKGKLGERQLELCGLTEMTPYVKSDFAIAETQDFRANIEKMVTRKNAMTGEEFQEPINTPFTSSPSSETYWCS
jgi:hypothetical protein